MKRVWTLGIAAIVLMGMTLPLALADDDGSPKPSRSERPERPDRENWTKPDHENKTRPDNMSRGEKMHGLLEHAKKFSRHGFNISLEANGTDRDNQSWTVEATGVGLGAKRIDNETGNVTGFLAFAILNATLLDENGTIANQGDIRIRIHGHVNETGEWKWHLVSLGKTPAGLPKLFVRGDSVDIEDGAAQLEGKGLALVSKVDDKRLLFLRLGSASVSIESL